VGVEQNLALHFEFRKDEKPKNKGFSRIFCQNRLQTVEDRLDIPDRCTGCCACPHIWVPQPTSTARPRLGRSAGLEVRSSGPNDVPVPLFLVWVQDAPTRVGSRTGPWGAYEVTLQSGGLSQGNSPTLRSTSHGIPPENLPNSEVLVRRYVIGSGSRNLCAKKRHHRSGH